MGPTYTEPMATAPDTTTEHTAPEDHTTHVTNSKQEQQEEYGPMPTNAAPSNDDCKRTVSAYLGPKGDDRWARTTGGRRGLGLEWEHVVFPTG